MPYPWISPPPALLWERGARAVGSPRLVAEDSLYCGGGVFLHARQDVGIDLEGEGDRGVAKHLADDFGRDALREEQGRGSVAQVVEADVGEPGSFEHGLEHALGDVLAAYRLATGAGEDQAVVGPEGAVSQPLFVLAGAMAVQRLDSHGGKVDGTATTRALRRWALPGGSSVFGEVERMLHAEGSGLQVYIVPAEGQELALTHAGGEGQNVERFQRVILDSLEQPFRLLRRQRLHFAAGGSWGGDQAGDIARDCAEALGVIEGSVKDSMNVGNAGRGETFGALGAIERLHLHGSELGEADPAKRGDDVMADIKLVAIPGARFDHWRALCLQPLHEEVGERLAVIG